YLAPEGCTSLSEVLVDLEAYLLDESGEQAKYACAQELAELQRDAKLVEQTRLQVEAALAEEIQSSSSSESEVSPFRSTPARTNKSTTKLRKKSKPYNRPTTSETPRPQFVEFLTQNKAGTKPAMGENEYWVHSIDWVNAPLTWDGELILPMPADEVVPYLKSEYGIFQEGKCKLDSCGATQPALSNLKNHLLSSSHINLRRKCQTCRFATRADMFNVRHNCRVQKGKNAEDIRRSPGWPVASYTWRPSK
ncbi:hypothetical protein LXA43DRAFT_887335, partial [Ganoderma leucocontextum]